MLCISTKGRYATRILVLLACLAPDATLTKHEIADFEGLTPGYVQQLMTPLQAAGLVMSYRGKQGGFKLGPVSGDHHSSRGLARHGGRDTAGALP